MESMFFLLLLRALVVERVDGRSVSTAAPDHSLHLSKIKRFVLKQALGEPVHRFTVILQDLGCTGVTAPKRSASLPDRSDRRVFREVTVLVDLTAKKDLFIFLTKSQRAKVGHTILTNHDRASSVAFSMSLEAPVVTGQ